MTLALALFLLRAASTLLLVALLVAVLLLLWRDVRASAQASRAEQRRYGALIGLRDIDGAGQPRETGEVYPLLPITSLGRATSNTIQLHDPFASTEHAVVQLRDGVWWLEDRASRNGTGVNGTPIQGPVILTEGDVINIGQTHFRLALEDERL